jgi:hypothetical protein
VQSRLSLYDPDLKSYIAENFALKTASITYEQLMAESE